MNRTVENKKRYLEAAKQCRSEIFDYMQKYENHIIDGGKIGRFYKHVNRKMTSKSGIGAIKSQRPVYYRSKFAGGRIQPVFLLVNSSQIMAFCRT